MLAKLQTVRETIREHMQHHEINCPWLGLRQQHICHVCKLTDQKA